MEPNQRGHYSILPMAVEIGLKLENDISWLRWWDDFGNLLLTGDERAIAEKQARLDAEAVADQQKAIADQQKAIADQQKAIATQATLAQQQAEAIADQERQQKEKLANYLRSLGINPDDLK
jgi:hypothetical protein